jgi:hypothetical protein
MYYLCCTFVDSFLAKFSEHVFRTVDGVDRVETVLG